MRRLRILCKGLILAKEMTFWAREVRGCCFKTLDIGQHWRQSPFIYQVKIKHTPFVFELVIELTSCGYKNLNCHASKWSLSCYLFYSGVILVPTRLFLVSLGQLKQGCRKSLWPSSSETSLQKFMQIMFQCIYVFWFWIEIWRHCPTVSQAFPRFLQPAGALQANSSKKIHKKYYWVEAWPLFS